MISTPNLLSIITSIFIIFVAFLLYKLASRKSTEQGLTEQEKSFLKKLREIKEQVSALDFTLAVSFYGSPSKEILYHRFPELKIIFVDYLPKGSPNFKKLAESAWKEIRDEIFNISFSTERRQ